jgi:hypothetical protein
MDRDIVDIGRLISFLGVLPMIAIALLKLASLPPGPSEYVAISVAPAALIWLFVSPAGLGIRSAWGESSAKDIFRAILIILSGIGAFLLAPYLGLYSPMDHMINQAGAAISIFGAIVITIGALMKS